VSQSAVLRHAYDSFVALLEKGGAESGLYRVGAADQGSGDSLASVSVSVTDLCQFSQDKNGQRIVVDELLYEMPSMFAMSLSVTVSAPSYPVVLEAAGTVAAIVKDNNVIAAGDGNWHGNEGLRMFIEPCIRGVDPRARAESPVPTVALEYVIEAGINSRRGERFTRVEKREVRANVME
jgi:hypothetical protein